MIDFLWGLLRAAGYGLAFQAGGAALFCAAFAERLGPSAPCIRRTAARAAAAALLVLVVQELFEPAHLAGEWAGLTEASLQRLVLSSSLGAALAARALGVAALAIGLRRRGAAARLVILAGYLLAAGSFALTGHTVVSPHRALLALLLLVHLSIAAFWFGSLVPLRQLCVLEPAADAASVLRSFSLAALCLVPLIPLAGLSLALVLLPDLAALREPYGLLLLGKLALLAVLLGLAALNKWRLLPALARGEARAARGLRRSIAAEYALLCAVFAVTAVLTGFFSPGEATGP